MVAGGPLPSIHATIALAVIAASLGLLGSDRRWTFPRLLMVMLVLQGVVHVMLMPSTTLPMQGMDMTGAAEMTAADAPSVGSAHAMGPAMLIAHVAAALVIAVLLRHGEVTCFAFGCLTANVFGALMTRVRTLSKSLVSPAPAALPRFRLSEATDIAKHLHAVVLAAHVVRRGPPAAACS